MNLGYREKTTVADLIAMLEEMPQDAQIVMSSDEEGNDFYKDINPENHNNLVVLYPGGSALELDDVEDYVYDEDDNEEE